MDKQEQLDKIENDKIIAEGQMLSDFVKSDGYTWFRRRLMDRIIHLSDIMALPVDRLSEVAARQIAVKSLLETLYELEGRAKQYDNNNELLLEIKKEDYIITL